MATEKQPTQTIRCAYQGCQKRFVKRRPNQKFHTDKCRVYAWNEQRDERIREEARQEILKEMGAKK